MKTSTAQAVWNTVLVPAIWLVLLLAIVCAGLSLADSRRQTVTGTVTKLWSLQTYTYVTLITDAGETLSLALTPQQYGSLSVESHCSFLLALSKQYAVKITNCTGGTHEQR